MQLRAAVGVEPGPVADQAVEDPLACQLGGAAVQPCKVGQPVTGLDRTPVLQLVENPTEGRFAVGVSHRPVGAADGNFPLQVAVVGKHPVAIAEGAPEGVAVVQSDHALGGFADVGQGIEGLEIEAGQMGRYRRKGRRGLFPVDVQGLAVWIEARQSPAVLVLSRRPAAAGQAMEGEAHVRGCVGAEGQKLTHRLLEGRKT